MNSHRFIPASLAAFFSLALGLLAPASTASAQTVFDFSSSQQLADNFTNNGATGGGTSAWSSAGGINGDPGRVNVSVSPTQRLTYFTTTSYDPGTASFTASYYFLASAFTAGGTNARIALGITLGTTFATNNLNDNAAIQTRLINASAANGGLRLEIRSGTGATQTQGVTLVTDNWYKLSATFTPNAATGSYLVSSSLENAGALGTGGLVSIATASGTRTDATYFSAGEALPVYFAILTQFGSGGAVAFDNVSVPFAAIPEANTFALPAFALAAALLAATRRRRR